MDNYTLYSALFIFHSDINATKLPNYPVLGWINYSISASINRRKGRSAPAI